MGAPLFYRHNNPNKRWRLVELHRVGPSKFIEEDISPASTVNVIAAGSSYRFESINNMVPFTNS